jgi:aquaporin Z
MEKFSNILPFSKLSIFEIRPKWGLKRSIMGHGPDEMKLVVDTKAMLAEFIGTFCLVVVGCGTACSNGWFDAQTRLLVAFAFGMTVMILNYSMSHLSGGHYNVAVTFALVISRQIHLVQGIANAVAQFFGSFIGAGVLCIMFPCSMDLTQNVASNTLNAEYGDAGRAIVAEAFATMILCFAIYETAVYTNSSCGKNACIAIGFSVFVGHILLLPIDGASMNPMRSSGPAIIAKLRSCENHLEGGLRDLWIMWVGPMIGGLLSGIIAHPGWPAVAKKLGLTEELYVPKPVAPKSSKKSSKSSKSSGSKGAGADDEDSDEEEEPPIGSYFFTAVGETTFAMFKAGLDSIRNIPLAIRSLRNIRAKWGGQRSVMGFGLKNWEPVIDTKAMMAEFIGTFVLVIVGCGTACSNGWFDAQTRLLVAFSFGMAVMILNYALSHHSGGQYNVAVTFCLILAQQIHFVQGIANAIAQFFGSFIGAGVLCLIFPCEMDFSKNIASNILNAEYADAGRAIVAEAFATWVLCLAIHETAVNCKSGCSKNACIAIGFAVFVGHILLLPIDGASMNPMRSTGPAIISKLRGCDDFLGGGLSDLWIMWVGPMVGAFFAGVCVHPGWSIVSETLAKHELASKSASRSTSKSTEGKD